MNTIVRKDDGVPVIVPNSVAADCLVANVSRSKAPKAV
jgi:small-conductance mechanosensitive channel